MSRPKSQKLNLLAIAAVCTDAAAVIAGQKPEVGFDGMQEKNIPWRGNRT